MSASKKRKRRLGRIGVEPLEARNLLSGSPPTPIDHVRTVVEDSGQIRIAVITDDIVGNDDDTEPLEIVSVTSVGAAQGTVTFEDFLVFYTPAPNFAGTDTFTYTVTDSFVDDNIAGLSGTANITINVTGTNDPPNAVDDTFNSAGSAVVMGDLLANNGNGVDTDIDGDSLTASRISGPSSGTLTVNSNGTFSYTPNTGFSGTDSFVYRISDGVLNDTATATININGSPIARNDAFSVNQGNDLMGNVRSNNGSGADSDPEGDSLSVNTTPVTPPANGSLTLNTNGTFTYSPDAGFSGADSFVYELSDGQSTSNATVSITVSAVNDPPVAKDDAVSGTEDNPITGNVLANNGNGVDSDPEGATLTATLLTQPSNGSVNLGSNGAFTYTPPSNFNGTTSFTYRINDGAGGTDDATVTLTVAAVNDPPSAKNDAFNINENTQLTGNVLNDNGNGADSDIEGSNLTVNTTPVTAPSSGTLTLNANGTFTYTPNNNFNGNDSFVYQVSDGQATSNATVSISVAFVNDPPVAKDDAAAGTEDNPISGNVLADNGNGVDADPEGAALTASVLTQPSNGTATVAANGDFTYTPNANFNGTDSFTYRINDGFGGTDDATVSLTVGAVNDAPLAQNDAFSTPENTQVTGNVLSDNGNGADSDVEGSPLTVETTPVTAPTNGNLTLNANGSFTYTPDNNFNGSDSFVYRVSDGQATSTATVNIGVAFVNDPPVAKDDSAAGTEDNPIAGNVLADNGNGVDADPEGAALTASVLTQPSNGTATVAANGDFTYTPNANFNGNDSFTYRINDGLGGTDDATVSLTVGAVNDAPLAQNDAFSTSENTQVTGNVLSDNGNGADSDVEGSPLTVETTPVTAPTNGSLTLNADGSFTYTPDSNFNGGDSFVYRVSDGQETSTATVSIAVAFTNDPPVAQDDSAAGTEDNPIAGNVLDDNGNGVDSDPEGATLTASILAQPSNGTVTLAANGDFTYTPNANFNGNDSFTYQINDGFGGTDDATVSLSVSAVNDDPTANNDTFSTDVDTPVGGDLLADNGSGIDSDIDGDALSVLTTPAVNPQNGAVTINADGTFTYTPNAGYSGTDTFEYTLSDGTATANATVSINVSSNANTPPVANDDSFSVDENMQASGNVLDDNGNGADTDSDADPLSTSLVADASNGVLVLNTDGSFTYTPDADFVGSDSFTYQLSDGNGGTDTATVDLTIGAVNNPPTLQDDSFSIDVDQQLIGNLRVDNGNGADSDPEGSVVIVNKTPISGPSNGSILFLASNGSLIYQPDPGFTGVDSFVYEARDLDGATSTATVSISVGTVDNSPPVAQDDSFAGDVDTVISGNVLDDNGNGADTDSDGDPLSTSLVADASNGVLVVNTDGSFTYTPDAEFVGSDSFTYQLSDGNGGTDTANVDITIGTVNNPPTLQDDSFSIDVDQQLVGNLRVDNGNGADSDPEGSVVIVNKTPVAGPSNGSIVFLATNGSLIYQPDPGFTGVDSFVYEASDLDGATSTATVSISVGTVDNNPPTLQDDNFSIDVDQQLIGNLRVDNGNGADSDPEGSVVIVNKTPVSGPSNGSIVFLATNGSLIYQPDPGFTGVDSFVYEARDLDGATSTATVNITVGTVNNPPTLQDDSFSIDVDQQLIGRLRDDNGNGPDSDPEGSVVIVNKTPVSGPSNGSIVFLATNGSLIYQPDPGFTGVDSFVYEARDLDGATSTATVTISVGNVDNIPPTLQDDSFSIDVDQQLTGRLRDDNGNGPDSDPEGSVVIVNKTPVLGPSNGSILFLATNGYFIYQPDPGFTGIDSFVYEASDIDGATSTATATITVTESLSAQSVTNDGSYVGEEDTAISGNVLTDNGIFGQDLAVTLARRGDVEDGSLTLNSDGTFEYIPNAGFVGQDRFRYLITNANGEISVAVVSITVLPAVGPQVANAMSYGGVDVDDPFDAFGFGEAGGLVSANSSLFASNVDNAMAGDDDADWMLF